MLFVLCRPQRIGLQILAGHEPGCLGGAAYTAQAEAAALADGVVDQAVVAADAGAVEGAAGTADRPGPAGQVFTQKAFESALTDKTYPGAVGLVVDEQAIVAGNGAGFAFVQPAQRE